MAWRGRRGHSLFACEPRVRRSSAVISSVVGRSSHLHGRWRRVRVLVRWTYTQEVVARPSATPISRVED